MSGAKSDREQAARLPEGDVVAVLLAQHARIRELFADVKAADGEHKKQAFDELRALLAVHETAEEMVVRPVARDTAGKKEADARNAEEAEANKVLARLEKMDVDSPEFDARLREFEKAVVEHAEHEEREEFPTLRAGRDEAQLKRMGTMLRAAEKVAPTHPHPVAAGSTAAQWSVGPIASLVDRTKDAIKGAMAR
ncbi:MULTISPECIES: hemerythrin domain-containing protein [Streptomyces]|uniref:hemerythrin domain-containing protein n=1 Tax=Streptomyces TaxID=1883 RepID=UPI00163D11AF|nr:MULTISPECIES: hemerythrin domain-containing protein [Streptomyces]MBC2876871.1 hemerythrin domain-containing protein [Streptomyces sp. TYQ1024]UBI35902.1 hemerythrin domain-containing protein [Streptomyces mobaraensis]UKW28496.1 hemerythrin domain-containing protein [Streptomyces sp. TYQ1024]